MYQTVFLLISLSWMTGFRLSAQMRLPTLLPNGDSLVHVSDFYTVDGMPFTEKVIRDNTSEKWYKVLISRTKNDSISIEGCYSPIIGYNRIIIPCYSYIHIMDYNFRTVRKVPSTGRDSWDDYYSGIAVVDDKYFIRYDTYGSWFDMYTNEGKLVIRHDGLFSSYPGEGLEGITAVCHEEAIVIRARGELKTEILVFKRDRKGRYPFRKQAGTMIPSTSSTILQATEHYIVSYGYEGVSVYDKQCRWITANEAFKWNGLFTAIEKNPGELMICSPDTLYQVEFATCSFKPFLAITDLPIDSSYKIASAEYFDCTWTLLLSRKSDPPGFYTYSLLKLSDDLQYLSCMDVGRYYLGQIRLDKGGFKKPY